MDISRKRVLFIGPGFFQYEQLIIKELEARGAIVYSFNSRYNFSFLEKMCLLHRNPSRAQRLSSKRIQSKLRKVPKDIDVIFVVKGDYFDDNVISTFKELFPHTPRVLYLWDSVKRTKNFKLLKKYFNTILSFDRIDCEKYDLIFRPLFYSIAADEKQNIKYDISFVGTGHTDRYMIVRSIKDNLEKYGYSYKFILITSRIYYFIERYIKHSIRACDSDLFSCNNIPYAEYINISKSSKCILDISHPLQTGLTIRTVESLGLQKIVITCNYDIKNYDNIAPGNYYCFDRSNPILDYSVFDKDRAFDPTGINRLSLTSFVSDILRVL